MSDVRLIALGNPAAGDDAAALLAVELVREPAEKVVAGRPGAGLVDLLAGDGPIVLTDVTRGLGETGRITSGRLEDLAERIAARAQVSSHGFGPAEALQLARVLGRPLPPIVFVGLEGGAFDPGTALSAEVERALPDFAAAIDRAIAALRAADDAPEVRGA